MITRGQLLELGYSRDAIDHRVAKRRLHPVHRGVYAVGRPELTPYGCFLAAVLSCGSGAALSHASAAALWEIRPQRGGLIEVSVPARARGTRPGIRVHRRTAIDVSRRHGIPVTSPIDTIIDIAPRLSRNEQEAAIGEADKRGLTDPEQLRKALDQRPRRPGVGLLRQTLDRHTFVMTDSELERRFLPIARRAGLPKPLTQQWLNGFRVDFYWPELKLVVETDGLTYHRTPAQQAEDGLRDQAHAAAGLIPLRFTHAQVRFDPDHVEKVLAAVASRLGCPRPAARRGPARGARGTSRSGRGSSAAPRGRAR